MFTTDVLAKMIRFYDNSVQGIFSSYLEKTLNLFIEQQSQLQQQIQELMATTPVNTMSDLTKRNLEIWREMQESFLKASGLNPTAPPKTSHKEDGK